MITGGIPMNRYERTISLKIIWTAIVRRWYVFFMIFIPVALISYIITDKMLTKTYVSSVSFSRGAGTTISTAQHTVMQTYITDTTENKDDPSKSGAIAKAVAALVQEKFTITAADIKAGISFKSMTNAAASFTVTFTYKNQSMVQPILKAVSEFAIENMHNSGVKDYTGATIVSPATAATKNSKERTYFLIALAAGFVVAFGIPFVDEIVSDEVYDKYDIEALGCSAFEVKAKPKKKEA